MGNALELDPVFIVLAVMMFIFFAIAMLVIIDHKAKIPDVDTDDLFSVSGKRVSHPAWAWMVSFCLWWVIGSLVVIISYTMISNFLAKEEVVADRSFLDNVAIEASQEQIRHFHNSPKETLYSKGKQPVCFYCHGDFPHAKTPMVRTLLNMHTMYVGCMTCHASPKKIAEDRMSFRWLNYSGIPTTGKPFGVEYDPETGNLMETDDQYSKIVPYYRTDDGTEELLEITEDAPEAKEFIAMRGQLTAQQQGAIKKRFHNIVNPKGRFCTRCHVPADDESGLLPFDELGFSKERARALTNLNIAGLVQKYKKFYMELVFLGNVPEDSKELLGDDIDISESTDLMADDPRAWWRENFGNDEDALDQQE
ncbi:MAG: hypothetical protein L3J28_08190 [Candidatus Polarisedimenticolaceae bacterium]|nr:hypothetical protein [Candidatus Polarisedimenticolaceae bacterium]